MDMQGWAWTVLTEVRWMIAKSVFDALGAKTYVINAMSRMERILIWNAGSTHIESPCRNFVKENQLDVGFAFDGDADRCIAVDENGNDRSTEI